MTSRRARLQDRRPWRIQSLTAGIAEARCCRAARQRSRRWDERPVDGKQTAMASHGAASGARRSRLDWRNDVAPQPQVAWLTRDCRQRHADCVESTLEAIPLAWPALPPALQPQAVPRLAWIQAGYRACVQMARRSCTAGRRLSR